MLISTVPGAIGVLQQHFQNVSDQHPELGIGVYIGGPPATARNNFLMIGDNDNGRLMSSYKMDFASLGGTQFRRKEEYGLLAYLRTWSGSSDPVARISDAFTIFNGVMDELASDVGASGAITPSGSWHIEDFSNIANGPFGGSGWGCTFSFTVAVINVQIVG